MVLVIIFNCTIWSNLILGNAKFVEMRNSKCREFEEPIRISHFEIVIPGYAGFQPACTRVVILAEYRRLEACVPRFAFPFLASFGAVG